VGVGVGIGGCGVGDRWVKSGRRWASGRTTAELISQGSDF
jgi:hypothetical protein